MYNAAASIFLRIGFTLNLICFFN